MMAARSTPYTLRVDVLGPRAPRWITAGLVVVLALWLHPVPASAETASFDVGDQAVVAIVDRGRANDITVRTWDRPTVQVESAEGMPAVDRRVAIFGTEKLPLTAPIPPMQYAAGSEGFGGGGGMLPPEEFPYSSFRPGPHDVVRVTAEPGAHLVVTVPASTGLLRTAILGGQTTIEGFRGANLYAVQGNGKLLITSVATTAFVQLSSGRLTLEDSFFERIRLRANSAHVVFAHCRSKQIEVTTVSGAIVYDGGTFDPGLARFDSQSGDIALGSVAAFAERARLHDVRRPDAGAAGPGRHGDGPTRGRRTARERDQRARQRLSLRRLAGQPARSAGGLASRAPSVRAAARVSGHPVASAQPPLAQSKNFRTSATSSLKVCCASTASSL